LPSFVSGGAVITPLIDSVVSFLVGITLRVNSYAMTPSIRVGAGMFLLSIIVSWADEKGAELEKGAAGAERKWVSLAPLKEGMGSWKALNFGGEGDTTWKEGTLTIEEGAELSGVVFRGKNLPEAPYELELEARRTSGVDFFCGLTLPVRDSKTCVTFICGGWGGGVVGFSSLDGMDASENETGSYQAFKDKEWYKIRLEIRKDSLKAWVGKRELVDVNTEGRKLGLRFGDIEKCAPLGLSTWQTTAELRGLRWRKLPE
tara:strand:- start:1407 stop:2183 length:777 start_codon:yes stop_codon:yes gene_type:complete